MLPEQQQRILGYFIEEAKDHLNTIEQGLLNLQNTIEDPEIVNEVFRAAHSVKGGAAMLGLDSISQTSHHLEDYFKVLQECPQIQADQKLESLFLRVFNNLKELLEQLEDSFALPENLVNNMMSEIEPVFEALNQHLGLLVQAGGGVLAEVKVRAVEVTDINESQITTLDAEVDLSDLFATKLDKNELLPKVSKPSVSLDSPDTTPSFGSLNETLAFDNLFSESGEVETPVLLATGEPEFCDLFDQPKESEELPHTSSIEEPFELEELWFSSDEKSNRLFNELPFKETFTLPVAELETTAATDLNVHIDNSLSTTEELSSTFDDLWNEQSSLDLTPVLKSSLSIDLPELGDINTTLADAQSVLDENEFGDLEALLGETTSTDEFFELDTLLDLDTLQPVTEATSTGQNLSLEVLSAETTEDEFGDLEALLEEETISKNTSQQEVDTGEYTVTPATSSSSIKQNQAQTAATKPRRVALEQMMKVPIKQLDNVSNLVGELVVNRNSLEQDQQRMRQSLDNLLHQVQQLNGLGSRMQDLYERSLMEASLINIRQGSWSASPDKSATSSGKHATGMDFDALEMDRFTGFHTLSQEMIELIVRVREASSDIEFVTDDTEQVARQFRQVTTQLQEGLTRSRMVPFSEIAERLPRAVRDISLKYGKQVELHIEGQETLIDKMLLQQLYDPMTHLVNNSITHGIETPAERATKGKPPVGKVTIRAFYQGNQTVIAVSDDGAGIDTDVVMTKAIQKGLITVAQARAMSRLDTYNLLFHPGFSTKDQADEYAGRGVGMDVVQTSLNEIRGTISTDSTLGKGTTFTIRLPLTLSICKALCCLSDKAQIAFPMDGVEDMMDISPNNVILNEEGQSCISWRDSLLPFRPLKELLTCNRQIGRGNLYGGKREDDMISIVVLRSAGTFIVVQVDQVLGEQEIVIKQFEGPAPKPVGVAGATVMGDGRIMPIADVLELIDLSTGRLQRKGGADLLWTSSAAPVLTTPDVKTEPMVLIVDDSITVRELLSLTFNKAGYRVEQARDGQEAWDKLRDGLPCDLVFCDIEMPRMDGLELLSRMQKDPNLSQLPIAMLTSRGADRHRKMAIQLGARGYFTKPYVEESLLDGAQRMLNGEVLVAAKSIV